MSGLIVCPLHYVPAMIAERRPSRVLTLLDPHHGMDPPLIPEGNWLRLDLHDIHFPQEGFTAAGQSDVERLIAFAEAWDEAAPLLIHCHAGISRSTASAFIVACLKSPSADETQIGLKLRAASPQAFPNRRLVQLADAILGREGRMLAGVEAMGGNGFISSSVPFDFPARHG
jgi:predicted protein tyrosine phosphatase